MSLLVGLGALGMLPASAVVGNPVSDGERPYVVRVEIGGTDRACSGALIEKMWIVTAASCFTDDPARYSSLTPGAPEMATRVVVGRTDLTAGGGAVRSIVELVPRQDRDLVLAKLSSVVQGVPTVALSAESPVDGEQLQVAGYGRTADEWAPVRLHSGSFRVTGSNGPELHIDGQDGATICRGDAGGPAVRSGAGSDLLVAISSRSWEGGCFGSETTSRAAVETRVDDITEWIGNQVARWSLKAAVNGTYVSVMETLDSDTGMLRARGANRYTQEQFTLHTDDGGASVALRSEANGLFVAPEIARTGDREAMLRARSTGVASWERFSLVTQNQATRSYALKSVLNGKFVAVEAAFTGSYANLLRARSDSVSGSWERFTLEHADNFRIDGIEPAGPSPLPVN